MQSLFCAIQGFNLWTAFCAGREPSEAWRHRICGKRRFRFHTYSIFTYFHIFSPVAIAKGSKGPLSVYKSRSRALHSATPLRFRCTGAWKFRLKAPTTAWDLKLASRRPLFLKICFRRQKLPDEEHTLSIFIYRTPFCKFGIHGSILWYCLIGFLMTPKLALFREGNKWAGQKKQLSRSSDQQLPSPSRFQAVLSRISFRFSFYVTANNA